MRFRLLPVIALATVVSGFAPQEPLPSVSAEVDAAQVDQPPQAQGVPDATGGEAPAAGAVRSGLPRRAPEPRTMKAQWPVFALLAASWLGIVAYLLVIGRRSRRLAELVERTGRPS
jgi:CcmD family protein